MSSTDKLSRDPNWGLDEFQLNYEMVKFNEHKSEGKHSKKVYDWEILELFFLHHNLDPIFDFYRQNIEEDELVEEVKYMLQNKSPAKDTYFEQGYLPNARTTLGPIGPPPPDKNELFLYTTE